MGRWGEVCWVGRSNDVRYNQKVLATAAAAATTAAALLVQHTLPLEGPCAWTAEARWVMWCISNASLFLLVLVLLPYFCSIRNPLWARLFFVAFTDACR